MILEKTKVLKVSKSADIKEDLQNLSFAAEIIKKGGLVVFPTETVYGLGANALDEKAVRKIYEAKGRPQNNPLIIHLAKSDDIDLYCETEKIVGLDALKALMPAPLTVILPAKPVIPSVITAGLPNVAARVPMSAAARKLIELSGVPIAAPSANLSGKPSPTCAKHVLEDMDGRADVIIDGGDCEVGVESTIITLCEEVPTLLRPGGITFEKLCSILGEVHMSHAVLESLKPGEQVLSPGMMYRHYAPDRPVELVKGNRMKCVDYINTRSSKETCAVICYDEQAPLLKCKYVLTAGSEKDNQAYASKLFSMLRDTNSLDVSYIFAFLPADTTGISLAIYNRLLRAAGFNVKTFDD